MTTNVKPIPEGHHTVTPYLMVKGVPRLIEFLEQAFDAKEIERMTGPDGVVGHAEVKIGDSMVMMGEATGDAKALPSWFYLYLPDADAAYRWALEAGGTSVQEPKDQIYGDRNAAIKDPVGNTWWVATRKENVSLEEIQRRAAQLRRQR